MLTIVTLLLFVVSLAASLAALEALDTECSLPARGRAPRLAQRLARGGDLHRRGGSGDSWSGRESCAGGHAHGGNDVSTDPRSRAAGVTTRSRCYLDVQFLRQIPIECSAPGRAASPSAVAASSRARRRRIRTITPGEMRYGRLAATRTRDDDASRRPLARSVPPAQRSG